MLKKTKKEAPQEAKVKSSSKEKKDQKEETPEEKMGMQFIGFEVVQ